MTSVAEPLVRVHWHHPEWVAVGVTAAGWAGVAGLAATSPAALLGHAQQHSAGRVLAHAAVMAPAMMTPLVLHQVHDLAVASLWRRRYRAVLGYMTGYLVTWTLAGAAMTLVAQALSAAVGRLATVAAAAAVATAVAGSADHQRRLRRCGVWRPLAVAGWRADRDCAAEGVRMAGRCIATTWALMFAVVAQQGLLVMAAATAVLVLERRRRLSRPGLSRRTAALGVCAVLVTAAGLSAPGAAHLDHDTHRGHATHHGP